MIATARYEQDGTTYVRAGGLSTSETDARIAADAELRPGESLCDDMTRVDGICTWEVIVNETQTRIDEMETGDIAFILEDETYTGGQRGAFADVDEFHTFCEDTGFDFDESVLIPAKRREDGMFVSQSGTVYDCTDASNVQVVDTE